MTSDEIREALRWFKSLDFGGVPISAYQAQQLYKAFASVSGELLALKKALEEEPELPGQMPDEMYRAMQGDRDACEEALRLTVQLTKQGILKRVAEIMEEGDGASTTH